MSCVPQFVAATIAMDHGGRNLMLTIVCLVAMIEKKSSLLIHMFGASDVAIFDACAYNVELVRGDRCKHLA